ncbi:hypothetical protein D9M68_966870 [compost metagenome]
MTIEVKCLRIPEATVHVLFIHCGSEWCETNGAELAREALSGSGQLLEGCCRTAIFPVRTVGFGVAEADCPKPNSLAS